MAFSSILPAHSRPCEPRVYHTLISLKDEKLESRTHQVDANAERVESPHTRFHVHMMPFRIRKLE